MKHSLIGSLAAALAISATTAHAEEAFTAGKAQIGGNVGYGIYVGEGNVNPYGFGLGAHGGYTLDMNLHLGASFEYFFGESQNVPGGSDSIKLWNLMFEPGYDIAIGDTMLIRPQLGIGLTNVSSEVCLNVPGVASGCNSDSTGRFAMAPGAKFMIDFGGFYGMAGLRFHHIFTDGGNADALLLNVGAGAMF